MGANFGFIATEAELAVDVLLDEVRAAAREVDCDAVDVSYRRADIAPFFVEAGEIAISTIGVYAYPAHPGLDEIAERLARRTRTGALAIVVSDLYQCAGYQHYFRGPVPTMDGEPIFETPDGTVAGYAGVLVDGSLRSAGRTYSYLDVAALGLGNLLGRELTPIDDVRLHLPETIFDAGTLVGAWSLSGKRKPVALAADRVPEAGWDTFAVTWPGAVRATRKRAREHQAKGR